MQYCPKCGSEVGDEHTFCFSCGAKLERHKPKSKAVKAKKKQDITWGILGFVIFELIAALVAIIPYEVSYSEWRNKVFKYYIWEDYPTALAGFLILAAATTALYTRYQKRTIRVIAPIIVVVSLLLTAKFARVALDIVFL